MGGASYQHFGHSYQQSVNNLGEVINIFLTFPFGPPVVVSDGQDNEDVGADDRAEKQDNDDNRSGVRGNRPKSWCERENNP